MQNLEAPDTDLWKLTPQNAAENALDTAVYAAKVKECMLGRRTFANKMSKVFTIVQDSAQLHWKQS